MPSSSVGAILLVDGYNVIGLWPCLCKTRDRYGLEASRCQLIEVLISYSAFQGYDTRIVFDSQYRDGPSTTETFSENLSVYYTNFGQTADTFIEKACASFRYDIQKLHKRLIVATSDRAQQLTVVGYGAEWMSAHQLVTDVEVSKYRVRQKQQQKKRADGRFLGNSLNQAALERLANLRQSLHQKK